MRVRQCSWVMSQSGRSAEKAGVVVTDGGWIALAVLALAVAVVLSWLVTSTRGRSDTTTQTTPVPQSDPDSGEILPAPDPSGVFETSLDGLVSHGDLLVVPDPDDPDQVLVFGDHGRVAGLGEIVANIPGQLAAVAVGAEALAKAGIAIGEQSGMLVRLTKESTQALRTLQTVRESGVVMGVLRDNTGVFRHVIRFRPVQGVQALTGITGVLGAVAMQAQLASIEKALAELTADVARVQVTLDNRASAEQSAVELVLLEIYRGAQATGLLTQAAWDQVAPLALPVRQNVEYAKSRLGALLDELNTRKSVGERRSWLRKNDAVLRQALAAVARTNQAHVQYSALRVWWLSVSGDRSLEHFVRELPDLIRSQRDRRELAGESVARALKGAGRTWWFDRAHSPFDTSALEKHVERLTESLTTTGFLKQTASVVEPSVELTSYEPSHDQPPELEERSFPADR